MQLLASLVIAVLISVTPLPLNLLIAGTAFALWFVGIIRGPQSTRDRRVAFLVLTVSAISGAIALPVKQLDRHVGPFNDEGMRIDDLCARLRADHRVMIRADRNIEETIVEPFQIERPMSRRAVLQKLAEETKCDARIGYRGTGATFLFGVHPSFTRLRQKTAQPSGAANGGSAELPRLTQ